MLEKYLADKSDEFKEGFLRGANFGRNIRLVTYRENVKMCDDKKIYIHKYVCDDCGLEYRATQKKVMCQVCSDEISKAR